MRRLPLSGMRTTKGFTTNKILPIEGTLIMKIRILSDRGETTEIGQSTGINVKTNLSVLIENCKIQCAFGHLKKFGVDINSVESGDVVEDLFDDYILTPISYIFQYPNYDGTKKYKYINVKHKRYLQTFVKRNGRFVFDERIKVKGLKKETENRIKGEFYAQ